MTSLCYDKNSFFSEIIGERGNLGERDGNENVSLKQKFNECN
jgi:hypothetical protein